VKGTEGKVDPIESTVALGHGTNNLAEVWGVGMALSLVRNLPIAGRPYRLVNFTDSNFTISVIQGSATSADFALHVYTIRSLYDELVKDKVVDSFELSWVPGHAGLEENERVDVLAKQGAEASRLGIKVVDRSACLRQRYFLYHARPP
jgi:ribonuclease HI